MVLHKNIIYNFIIEYFSSNSLSLQKAYYYLNKPKQTRKHNNKNTIQTKIFFLLNIIFNFLTKYKKKIKITKKNNIFFLITYCIIKI